jgi:sulfonate transport system permease protein
MRTPPLVAGIGGIAIFLALWELAVRSELSQHEYLPPPSAIAAALIALPTTRPLAAEFAHTLTAVFLGFAIAVALGLVGGMALGLSAAVRRYGLATVEVLRSLPGITFVPLAMLLFGFSLQMELTVIVFPAIWPVLVNTMGGIQALPQRLHDIAHTMRLSRADALFKIYMPAAAPAILVGCRLSLTLALVLAVIAEMVGNPEGLGYAVVREQQGLQPAFMFAYVFIIGFTGIALNALVVAAGKAILPGEFRRPSAAEERAA